MSKLTYEQALGIVTQFIKISERDIYNSAKDDRGVIQDIEDYRRGQLHGLQTTRYFIEALHDLVVDEEAFDISLCEACKNRRNCKLYCEGRNFEPRAFKMFIHNIKMNMINKWKENQKHGQNR